MRPSLFTGRAAAEPLARSLYFLMTISDTRRPQAGRSGWVIVISLVVLFWALKAASAVILPITAGAFLVALVYPVYRWTARHVHKAVGLLAAFSVVVAGFALFFSLMGWALSTVASELPQYEEELRQAYNTVQASFQQVGVALPEPEAALGSDLLASQLLSSAARTAGLKVQAFLTYFFLTLAFVALGLPEVRTYAHKFDAIGGAADKLIRAFDQFGSMFRAYAGAITASAAITAILTVLFAYIIGLEFAFVFALLSFLMNYVPTIGSVIAVIPPTLFAFIQFDGLTMPLVVFAGFSAIELTVGNYVAPLIEGRILSMATTLILAAIVFWGWLWGVVGALLAIPLTMAIGLVCHEFDGARWVAMLINSEDG